jgi:hypothetical protein
MSRLEQLTMIERSMDFLEAEMDAQEQRLKTANAQQEAKCARALELMARVASLRRDFERVKRLPPDNRSTPSTSSISSP